MLRQATVSERTARAEEAARLAAEEAAAAAQREAEEQEAARKRAQALAEEEADRRRQEELEAEQGEQRRRAEDEARRKRREEVRLALRMLAKLRLKGAVLPAGEELGEAEAPGPQRVPGDGGVWRGLQPGAGRGVSGDGGRGYPAGNRAAAERQDGAPPSSASLARENCCGQQVHSLRPSPTHPYEAVPSRCQPTELTLT